MPLYECRNCSVLLMERKRTCPACNSTNANHGSSGSALRRVGAEELLGALQ